jgi:hypothetical protein
VRFQGPSCLVKIAMSIRLSFLLSICLVAASCSNKKSSPEAVATIDSVNGATITGTVKLAGECSADQCVMCSDTTCHQAMVTQQHWLVRDGRVANAFIYIKDGLGNKVYVAPAAPAVLDQKGCLYKPHVMGMVVGQTLKVLNSDSTLHNVKLISANTSECFNRLFPQGMAPMTQKMNVPGVMKKISCDVHSWMNSYVGVLPHPFFAVSDTSGRYQIKGIPPGEYTLELWHESSKGSDDAIIQTQKITVAARDSKTADFTISAR